MCRKIILSNAVELKPALRPIGPCLAILLLFEALIVDALDAAPDGLTREQLAEVAGISLATVCGRVCPLIHERKIPALKIDPVTGKVGRRLTKSGRYAAVGILNLHLEVK